MLCRCLRDTSASPRQPLYTQFPGLLASMIRSSVKSAAVPYSTNVSALVLHAGVGALESAYLIVKGKAPDLSEQQMVSCVTESSGCSGGEYMAVVVPAQV